MVTGHPDDGLLRAWSEAIASGGDLDVARADAVARYGFAVPTDEALDAIVARSPSGVVEIGAGTGYWAAQLTARGAVVHASDLEPPGSAANQWFASSTAWFAVERRDHRVAELHPDATLLIVWPTKDETWPADALERYRAVGGSCVAYVGEPPGGATGDDRFHALLGELTVCIHHRHGVLSAPCVCDVDAQWRRDVIVELPNWPGHTDRLVLFVPAEGTTTGGGTSTRAWRPWHRRRPATSRR